MFVTVVTYAIDIMQIFAVNMIHLEYGYVQWKKIILEIILLVILLIEMMGIIVVVGTIRI
jgi:hypothetical protein